MYAIRSYYVFELDAAGDLGEKARVGNEYWAPGPEHLPDGTGRDLLAETLAECVGDAAAVFDAEIFALAVDEHDGAARITTYNVCYTKLLRARPWTMCL